MKETSLRSRIKNQKIKKETFYPIKFRSTIYTYTSKFKIEEGLDYNVNTVIENEKRVVSVTRIK